MNFVSKNWYELNPSTYLSDGSLIINSAGYCGNGQCVFGLHEYQGITLNQDIAVSDSEEGWKVTMKIDNQGNYVWHHTIYGTRIY